VSNQALRDGKRWPSTVLRFANKKALEGADIVILAVPDDVIGTISDEILPRLDAGTMVVLLGPAAAYADVPRA